ncbi:MAG TPA: DUF4260 domain-containing protein [Ktedonobacterales bacterium]
MPRTQPTALLTQPTTLLRAEGAALLALTVIAYAHLGGNWILFAVLLLAPDLSALGYLAGTAIGATCYNLAHNTVLPLALGAYAILGGQTALLPFALIWLAHIGMDRLLGYGLKYPDSFTHTHLVSKPPKSA